jgi:hypothetical protein
VDGTEEKLPKEQSSSSSYSLLHTATRDFSVQQQSKLLTHRKGAWILSVFARRSYGKNVIVYLRWWRECGAELVGCNVEFDWNNDVIVNVSEVVAVDLMEFMMLNLMKVPTAEIIWR